jgi:hypothetical protein
MRFEAVLAGPLTLLSMLWWSGAAAPKPQHDAGRVDDANWDAMCAPGVSPAAKLKLGPTDNVLDDWVWL